MFKLLALVALVAVASAHIIGTPDMIEEINRSQDSWVAKANKFSGMTTTEVQRFLMGTILHEIEPRPSKEAELLKPYLNVPKTFDARKQWPKAIHPIRDQAQCGSCWAFSAAEVLTDRFTIQSQGSTDVVLSPQDMVSCD